MVDVSVVHDKLSTFESATELAEYFKSVGIYGLKENRVACPISQYVMMETGLTAVSTGLDCLWVYRTDGELAFCQAHTEAMADFVFRFDHGVYPDLEEPY